eukprot:366119-Chlamydomonas_euryale.AAC.44
MHTNCCCTIDFRACAAREQSVGGGAASRHRFLLQRLRQLLSSTASRPAARLRQWRARLVAREGRSEAGSQLRHPGRTPRGSVMRAAAARSGPRPRAP